MTYEEAINYLKPLSIDLVIVGDEVDISGEMLMKNIKQALDMAIEALEKQIQKKPLKSDKTIRYCEVWECPGCGFEWSGRVVDYCYKCGQAINWEGVKDNE